MANRYAVASGNWSNTATWNGGTLPTSADDVYSNNFTVAVDQNIDVLSLRNTAAAPIVAGGTFNFNTAGVTASITGATPLAVGAANLLTFTHASGNVTASFTNNITLTLNTISPLILYSGNGNVNFNVPNTAITIGGASVVTYINKTGGGLLTLNGNITLNQPSGITAALRFLESINGNVVINGNVTQPGAGSNTSTTYTINQSVGALTISGNVSPAGVYSTTIRTINFTGTTLTINGNLLTGVGANVLSSGTTIINGDVYGTTNASGFGLSTSGNTTITGNIYANNGSTVLVTSTNTLTVNGNISASSSGNGVGFQNVNGVLILSGSLYNVNGKQAVNAPNIFVNQSAPMVAQFFSSAGQNITMYSQDTLANYPSTSNVRQGTVYGVASGSVGTLAIPNATDVRNGVTYDATTTGSGLFTTDTLLSEISSSSEPIAARIRNAGTVEVLGKLLESFRK